MPAGGGLFVVPPMLFADGVRKCSPQDCAGRSLPSAEARNSLAFESVLRRLLPENISLIHTRQPNP